MRRVTKRHLPFFWRFLLQTWHSAFHGGSAEIFGKYSVPARSLPLIMRSSLLSLRMSLRMTHASRRFNESSSHGVRALEACVFRILSPTYVPESCKDGSMGDNTLWKFAQVPPVLAPPLPPLARESNFHVAMHDVMMARGTRPYSGLAKRCWAYRTWTSLPTSMLETLPRSNAPCIAPTLPGSGPQSRRRPGDGLARRDRRAAR
jgi:hypothetical protein